jgi:hypothetical protein
MTLIGRVLVGVLVLQISKALAVAELASGAVTAACAAAAETILSGFDALSVDHIVDEPEISR